ncbi:hypothetical protein PPL_02837 [Heterostelium album PN500]|uniref:Uncharacterized protein n=1 Tax=Heterostelium pallidum (strain ATCC 26659 / Pp 5 / PN500) TaxID=670386 RepID=D3B372_HETP5|nr:hypothetical protein PPL_02837 [Heterostelium album PN500]EFA83770.1 hypothetical protein PPL_02837 [Heterostelium album PN500]|eukprot:XP_020435887.1 hypothetical protein PPL_02837 [Heterostelium album PN500]
MGLVAIRTVLFIIFCFWIVSIALTSVSLTKDWYYIHIKQQNISSINNYYFNLFEYKHSINFLRCGGTNFCDNFKGNNQTLTNPYNPGSDTPTKIEYGPSKGFYLGLAALVVLFVNQFIGCALSKMKTEKIDMTTKNRYGIELTNTNQNKVDEELKQ